MAEACIKLETIALCVDMLPMSWEPLAALQVMKGAAQQLLPASSFMMRGSSTQFESKRLCGVVGKGDVVGRAGYAPLMICFHAVRMQLATALEENLVGLA